jgi:hypothetical protein
MRSTPEVVAEVYAPLSDHRSQTPGSGIADIERRGGRCRHALATHIDAGDRKPRSGNIPVHCQLAAT